MQTSAITSITSTPVALRVAVAGASSTPNFPCRLPKLSNERCSLDGTQRVLYLSFMDYGKKSVHRLGSSYQLWRESIALSDPSLNVNPDIVVEWRNFGIEVAVQLMKYPDVFCRKRHALVVHGLHDCFSLNWSVSRTSSLSR